MREAVIVSTARTPIGKAYRGAFNNTEAPTLGGHAIKHAVERASIDPAEIDDVVMGCAMPQGTQGKNVARQALLVASLLPDNLSAEGVAAAWNAITEEQDMRIYASGFDQASKFATKNAEKLGIEL